MLCGVPSKKLTFIYVLEHAKFIHFYLYTCQNYTSKNSQYHTPLKRELFAIEFGGLSPLPSDDCDGSRYTFCLQDISHRIHGDWYILPDIWLILNGKV